MDKKYNSLPDEPEKRRVILVLSNSGLETLDQRSYSDSSVYSLLKNNQDNQVSLLNVDDPATQNSSLVKKLKGSGLLNPGSILIQSPYNTSLYANANEASYKFAQEKCVVFAELCNYLAARKVFAKQMELKTANTQKKFTGDINSSYGGIGGQAATNAWEEMKKQVKLDETYPQQDPIIDAAKDLIEEFQFLSDPYINSLFRRRKSGIRIESSKYTLNVTEESKQNLDLAFSLGIPPQIGLQVGLKVNIETLKQETFEFSVDYEVEFW
jgi:hypothetical protein